ncbi:flavin reductase family protein [Metabacillus sp. GX 13764]|uniref:flavin reductase family protein n=1 Tax=Metabacillus kandeliae TaxID=2900151 RepID=UPI001E32D79E|nr:flavin reductase family protein [Metabacillus kandeliae]MCD7035911.1 flavin reductase family protein [Metabacillus kandeliae]
MKSIDPADLEMKENYKILTGTIVPRPIAFVTSLAEDGTLNAAPFSYFNIISADPPMVSIAVQRNPGGERKDTARNAEYKGEFVVHITDEDNVEKANETSAGVPADVSEVEMTGLETVESTKVSVPGLVNAKVRFECATETIIPLGGTKGEPSCDLLIGRILHYHLDQEVYQDNGHTDYRKLKPVSRLAGNDYGKLGELFALKRPK